MRIKRDDGRWIKDEEGIIGKLKEFFQSLFQSNGNKEWGRVLEDVPEMVIGEMNAKFVRKVSKKEVTEVVLQLGSYKAPRPNGFGGIFYQRF